MASKGRPWADLGDVDGLEPVLTDGWGAGPEANVTGWARGDNRVHELGVGPLAPGIFTFCMQSVVNDMDLGGTKLRSASLLPFDQALGGEGRRAISWGLNLRPP